MDAEKLDLLKRTLAADANLTNAELQLFGSVCERKGLDPFAGQIHVSKRGGKLIIQTGIDGFRLIAERTRNYAGQDPPQWCGPDGQWTDVWVGKAPPVAARVNVYRKDWQRPMTAVALWEEYKQLTRDGSINQMWRTRGASQLAKCAEALALRKAFPQDLSGLYTSDEMGQADNPIDVQEAPQAPVEPSPLDLLRGAYNALSKPQQQMLRDWWKTTDLPSGNNLGETFAALLEQAPQRLDEVLRACEKASNGEVLVPPVPEAETEPVEFTPDVIDADVVDDQDRESGGGDEDRTAQDRAKFPPIPESAQGAPASSPSPEERMDELKRILRDENVSGPGRLVFLEPYIGRLAKRMDDLTPMEVELAIKALTD